MFETSLIIMLQYIPSKRNFNIGCNSCRIHLNLILMFINRLNFLPWLLLRCTDVDPGFPFFIPSFSEEYLYGLKMRTDIFLKRESKLFTVSTKFILKKELFISCR